MANFFLALMVKPEFCVTKHRSTKEMKPALFRIAVLAAVIASIGGIALFFLDRDRSRFGYERYDAMFRATRDGDLSKVKRLIGLGADPTGIKDYTAGELYMEFTSPLMVAVENRDHKMMDFLLTSGADPNFVEGSMWTPLMCAIENKDEYAVAQLLRHGATISSGYGEDDNAIEHATRRELPSIRNVLIAHKEATNVEQADATNGLPSATRKRDDN
jgi:hypothetical protein